MLLSNLSKAVEGVFLGRKAGKSSRGGSGRVVFPPLVGTKSVSRDTAAIAPCGVSLRVDPTLISVDPTCGSPTSTG